MLDVPKRFGMIGSHVFCKFQTQAPPVPTAQSLSGVQRAGALPDCRFIINPECLVLPLDLLHGLNRDQLVSSLSKPLCQDPALSQVMAARVRLQLLLKAHPGLPPPPGPAIPARFPAARRRHIPPLPC